jgi:hypothetical protein
MEIPMLPKQRARASNRGHLMPNVDGRSAKARRYRDILNGYLDQFAGAVLSEGDYVQIKQAATMSLLAEGLSARAVSGEVIDSAELARLCSTAQSLLADVRATASDPRHASACV